MTERKKGSGTFVHSAKYRDMHRCTSVVDEETMLSDASADISWAAEGFSFEGFSKTEP